MTLHGVHMLLYPNGYLMVLGTAVPFPPAFVLWGLVALDIALTAAVFARPRRWRLALLGLALSAYLTVAGIFSIGILLLLLLLVQLVWLVRLALRNLGSAAR